MHPANLTLNSGLCMPTFQENKSESNGVGTSFTRHHSDSRQIQDGELEENLDNMWRNDSLRQSTFT